MKGKRGWEEERRWRVYKVTGAQPNRSGVSGPAQEVMCFPLLQILL